MKLEVIKSYTLLILVGISLILSYSLWSYQPKDKDMEKEGLLTEEQIDLGGKEETKKSLVQPSHIIFDVQNRYYGFDSPLRMQGLYEDMKSWVLYNFRRSEANGPPNEKNQVELIYPVSMPMAIIESLFTVNNGDSVNLPDDLSFQRVYIALKPDHSLTFIFLATDGRTQVKADVNNAQKYELLSSYMSNLDGLSEYVELQEDDYPIYLPVEPVKTSAYIFNVTNDTIKDPEILKNALFMDPSRVLENGSEDLETWYHDGHRTMKVYENRLYMEYVNPEETESYDRVTFLELLDQSIAKINGYKGWIQEYHLESLDTVQNTIRYQMYYRGYPVFNHNGLSTIEQKLVENELRGHRQSLFTIKNAFLPENYELSSGGVIINHLKNNSSYGLNDIEDIRIGYRLGYIEITKERIQLSLTPAWFMKVKGNWQQIITDEDINRKGVS